MIELIADAKYKIDLPNDIEISIVIENPLFLEDRIPAPYSLDFEVPATSGNLMAFGYPTRPTSRIVKRKVSASLKYFGLIFGYGELILLESQKQLKLQFKGSLEHENVEKNINQLDLGEYDFGYTGNPYIQGPNISTNYLKVDYYEPGYSYNPGKWNNYRIYMHNQAINATDFVIAPVKIKGTDSWNGPEASNGIVNTLNQYINYWDPNYNAFGIENYFADSHTPILPFPYLWKVIENGFGGQLVSNPFTVGDLRKLVLVSQNHKNYIFNYLYHEWYDTMLGYERWHKSLLPVVEEHEYGMFHLSIKMKSCMQAYLFRNFLKNILKIFCMTAYASSKYSLEFNNDIFNRNVIKSLDAQLVDELLITYEDGKDYVFTYADYGESNLKNFEPITNVQSIYDSLMSTTPGFQNEHKDLSSGAIFKGEVQLKGLASEKRITSEVIRSALSIEKTGSNKERYEVSSDISPLDMNIHKYWWINDNPTDIIPMRHWFVPEIEKKSVDAAPNIMFHGGMVDNFEHNGQYPYLMAHHTDHFGVKRLNTSLVPGGTGGLMEKFHGKYKEWMEKDKIKAQGNFRLTPLEVKNLDIRDKFHVKGQLFYIEKMEYAITHRNISLVDMYLVGV
ncbi:MAG: hypothetical protein ACOYO1_12835 [Bacteroidales bacterium]